jgi:hypothetical protein
MREVMANPMKGEFRGTYHSKFSKIVGGAAKNEIQPDRAERITGITPSETIPQPPEAAVPQQKGERRSDDPPYKGDY